MTHDDPVRVSLAAQAEEYAELSRIHAVRGDGRRAALSAWAADLRAVQSTVLESGANLDDLLAVAAGLQNALAVPATEEAPGVRTVVEAARGRLLDTLDDSLREQLRGRLASLDHLDAVPAPAPGAANEAVTGRLDGRGGEQLVGDLLTAAADCRAVARVMAQVGDEEERRRQDDAADAAAFEAFLVLVSAATGDATLATTELRWDLAAVKAGRDPHADRRELLCSVLVPGEREALGHVFGLRHPVREAG